MKQGICTKCGKEGKVVMHHTKGYDGDYKDFVLPYCHSCHKKIHIEARRSGICTIDPKYLNKKSHNSCTRRLRKQKDFYGKIVYGVGYCERIEVWGDKISLYSYFRVTNGQKLVYVDI